MKNNRFNTVYSLKRLSVFVLVALFALSACEEDTPEVCATNLTNTDVSDTNLTGGDIFSGEVDFRETIGVDDLQLQSMVSWHLSEDNTLGGDVTLTAFLDNNQTSRSGDNVSLTFDEIEIPLNQASGDYFLIVRLKGQPCGGGEVSDDDTEAIAVTIN